MSSTAVFGLACLLALGVPADTAAPTPTPTMVPATGTPATFPVEDLVFPVGDLIFPEASGDGAVTDLGGKEFRLAADVLFAFDKADLNARARKELAAIAVRLKDGRAAGVAVVGYTDSQGADAYNAVLSAHRAESVRTWLAAALGSGVAVTAEGKGEADPIAENKTKAGQALNRRVTITVTR